MESLVLAEATSGTVPWRSGKRCSKIENLEDRAMTVRQLREMRTLLQRLCKAGLLKNLNSPYCRGESWAQPDKDDFGRILPEGAPLEWGQINLYHITDEVIKPVIKYIDPSTKGYSWVELVADRPQRVQIFFSHFWGGKFRDFMQMVEMTCKDHNLHEDSTIWICTFANSQFRNEQSMNGSLNEIPFKVSLEAAAIFQLIVDRGGGSLTRTWCGFELKLACETMRGKMLLYTPGGRVGSERVRSGPLVEMVQSWDIRDTSCTERADRRRILNYIAGEPEFNEIRTEQTGVQVTMTLADDMLVDSSAPEFRFRPGTREPDLAYEAKLFKAKEVPFLDLNRTVRSTLQEVLKAQEIVGLAMPDPASRGVTLAQLRAFWSKVKTICIKQDLWDSSSERYITWETINCYQLKTLIVHPATADMKNSYMETIADRFQEPHTFILQAWSSKMKYIMDQIEWLAEARGFSDDHTFFFDVLSLNQHYYDSMSDKTLALQDIDRISGVCNALLYIGSDDANAMRSGQRMTMVANIFHRKVPFDLGTPTGVIACAPGKPFPDGSWVCGSVDPQIAQLFCDTKCQDAWHRYPENKERCEKSIVEAFGGSLSEAQDHFNNFRVALIAGPVLRNAALQNDSRKVQDVCRNKFLDLTSDTLKGELGQTAVHVAAAAGSLAALSTLLEVRMDPNAHDSIKETPLHYAALAGQAASMRILLKFVAEKSIQSTLKQSPMDVAVQNPAAFLGVKTEEVIRVLG